LFATVNGLTEYKYKLACLLLGLTLLVSGCNTTKYLSEGEYLVVENEIEFEDESPLEDQFRIESTLASILKQQPNSTYIGIKREWLYQKTLTEEDFWLKEWMKERGEAPVVFDSLLASESVLALRNYLFNHGYFDGEVEYEVELENKKAEVTYKVTTHAPYYIDDLVYSSPDSSIVDLLDSLRNTSLLKEGEIIEDVTYQLEKTRITESFLDHGYANFYSNLISPLRVDTTKDKIVVRLEVFPPSGNGRFQIKKIGKVNILNDYQLGEKNIPDTTFQSLGFSFNNMLAKPTVREDIIADKIYLRTGEITTKRNFDNTYRSLSDLGVFRFISINPEQSKERENEVDYTIQLTPNKKWAFDTGLDFNYSTIQTEGAGRNLIGLRGSATLQNRNLFRKAINLTLKAEVGAEINVAEIDSFNTFSTNLEASINIPRFSGFPGTLRFLSLINLGKNKLLNPDFYQSLQERASTKMSLQYQNVSVSRFYQYASVNMSYGYDVPINNRKRYNITTMGINYYRPDTFSQFSVITRGEEYVVRSFLGDRLFTGFLYRDFSFTYKSKANRRGDYWIANFFNEVSGLEVWAINNLYNSITNKTGKFVLQLDKDIDFARFTRFEFQYRHYVKLPGNQELAFRINPAIAVGLDSLNIPYVKQYFMGGPQSLRAFRIREVGPGGNDISTTVGENQPFFSAGDFKLEFNIEYRFDLFWLFESAVFLDAGNVWLLDAEEGDPGLLTTDFWKQIAIGTGVGLRLDLSFVLLRLDMGYRLRTPYERNGSHWYWQQEPIVLGKVFNDIVYNLAIGYPF
jgi:outer membrane protein assembly factor BamA